MDLNTIWFVLLGVLLTGYAILDGFDLGVGILHLAARNDDERRTLIGSIGPLWDGNEVWLVTFGGALFAAYKNAYAAVFSGFYTAFMVVLGALIFRAVSIEFRSKRPYGWWRRIWDVAFFLSSTTAALIFGVAVGNAIAGIPIGARGRFQGGFFDLLRPYPLLVGAFVVATFALHGSIYLCLKTEGDLHRRVHDWAWRSFGFFLITYMLATIFTLARVPDAIRNFSTLPWAWLVVFLNVLAIANIPRSLFHGRHLAAFISSSCSIAAFNFLFGIAIFPNLVVSSLDPSCNLTIYDAASSPLTLKIMLIVAILGMPFVLAYSAVVYWVFRGKTKLEITGY